MQNRDVNSVCKIFNQLASTKRKREDSEKPHRKRRKKTDGPWTKNTENKKNKFKENSPDFLPNIRTDKRTKAYGKPINTSAIFLDNTLSTKAKAVLEEKIKQVPNHVPVGEIVEQTPTGTPIRAKTATPRRRSLYLTDTNGEASFFTTKTPDRKPRLSITHLSPASERAFRFSEIASEIKTNTKIEPFEIHITQELLDEAHKKTRSPSQNDVMGGSATKYAQETGQFSCDLSWEWAHYIGHKFIGNLGQHEKNMDCKTYHANTVQLLVELRLPQLLQKYPNGFILRIDPQFVKGTQISTVTRFTVMDPFSREAIFKFKFDGQQQLRPHFNEHLYMGHLFDTVCQEDPSPETPIAANPDEILFSPRLFTSPPNLNRFGVKMLNFNDIEDDDLQLTPQI